MWSVFKQDQVQRWRFDCFVSWSVLSWRLGLRGWRLGLRAGGSGLGVRHPQTTLQASHRDCDYL